MAYVERHTIVPITDSSGDVTAYTPDIMGRLIDIAYTKDGTTPYANGVDFTITTESTGRTLWTQVNQDASATKAPRQPTHDTVGAALVYGTNNDPVGDHVYIARERIKIVIADGGDTKTGSFVITIA